jgi:hypothetical protein
VTYIRFPPPEVIKGGWTRKDAYVRNSVVIRHSPFVRGFGSETRWVEWSAVECSSADNGSWRSDRFVNENQVSDSGREDTCSPLRNGASLRQSLIVSCCNWLELREIAKKKEASVSRNIQSRTRYYSSRNPEYVTIFTKLHNLKRQKTEPLMR